MKLFAEIIQKTLPSSLEDVDLEQRVLNWLWFVFSCLQMGMYFLFFVVYSTLLYSDLVTPTTIGFSIFILGIALAWFVANGPNNLSLNLGSASVLLAVVIPAFHSGGIQFPALIWMIPCLLFSALLQQKRAFLAWLIVFLSTYTAVYLWGPPASEAFLRLAPTEEYLHRSIALVVVGFQMFSVAYAYSTIVQEKGRLQAELSGTLEENQNLIRILSHDIANPLTVLDLSLQRIHPTDPMMVKSLDRATKATRTIRELLDEVKSWQSLSDGKQSVALNIASVDEIIQKSIDCFSEKLLEKQILVLFSPSLFSVYVDSFILTNQVINNLLSNAIKFSPEGSEIRIWASELNDSIAIHVADEGIGMPPSLVGQIFSVDTKTSRPGTFGESGTGFGMPILKSSLEKMGGTVSVTSRCIDDFPDDHGTTFIVVVQKGPMMAQPLPKKAA